MSALSLVLVVVLQAIKIKSQIKGVIAVRECQSILANMERADVLLSCIEGEPLKKTEFKECVQEIVFVSSGIYCSIFLESSIFSIRVFIIIFYFFLRLTQLDFSNGTWTIKEIRVTQVNFTSAVSVFNTEYFQVAHSLADAQVIHNCLLSYKQSAADVAVQLDYPSCSNYLLSCGSMTASRCVNVCRSSDYCAAVMRCLAGFPFNAEWESKMVLYVMLLVHNLQ